MTDALQRLQRAQTASIARAGAKAVASLRLYQGRRLVLAFVPLLLVILLGNALLALHNFDTVVAGERAVSQTHAVEAQITVLESVLVGAESGAQYYVLTGDPADLTPYVSARSTIDAEVARLRALTAADRIEQARLAVLEPLIAQVFAQLQQTIDLRMQQRTAAAIALVHAGYGHQTMKACQAVLDEMTVTEGRRLDLQMGIAEGNRTAAQIMTLLAVLADVVLLAVLVTLVSRTFAARERYLQAERAARAAAEAAVAQRDQFLSVASHELRTPLTVLLGNIQLLERRLSRTAGSDAHLHQSFAAIHRQLARLQALVTAMLDISRIERGQLKIAREPLDVAALVRAAVDEVRPTAQGHPIELVIHCDPPSAALVRGDALRLEQVLLNLLQNAIKYSPEGGPIRVEVTCAADHVSISVA
ncbi:MAG: sensor histidine kinase, partial [Ktedonobacterales bacterium]